MLSALGLLLADIRVDKIWTQAFRSTDVDAALVERAVRADHASVRSTSCARRASTASRRCSGAINMRYLGQNYEHEVEIDAGEHRRDGARRAPSDASTSCTRERYGYAIEGEVIELVSFKVTAIGQPAGTLDLVAPDARRAALRSRSTEVYFRGHGCARRAGPYTARRSQPGERDRRARR